VVGSIFLGLEGFNKIIIFTYLFICIYIFIQKIENCEIFIRKLYFIKNVACFPFLREIIIFREYKIGM